MASFGEKQESECCSLPGSDRHVDIILADTLLDNYSDDEIEAVLAHELGRRVHRHILKSIFVQAESYSVGILGWFFVSVR